MLLIKVDCILWPLFVLNFSIGITFVFFCHIGAWTQGLHIEPLYQPFFVIGF
jgi:hypothetical protein